MAHALLIVDDEPRLLRLLVRLFEREGYAVLAAADGESALALAAPRAGELVAAVLDAGLAPRGAAELLASLRALCPGLGCVVASGSAPDAALAERLAAAGGVFVRKPFAAPALVEAVARVARPLPRAAGREPA